MDSPISPQINKKVNDLSFYLSEMVLKEEKCDGQMDSTISPQINKKVKKGSK